MLDACVLRENRRLYLLRVSPQLATTLNLEWNLVILLP